MIIRNLQEEDYPACAAIYEAGIASGIATFETKIPEWFIWDAKFLKLCRFVAVKDTEILGWIALTPFSKREVYKGVTEVSVYISKDCRGLGIGKSLLQYLVTESEKEGFWTLQAKIFPQNEPSLALFARCGFRKVGVREKLGMRDGIWYDNVLMERRK